MTKKIDHRPWQRVIEGVARAVRLGRMPNGIEEHRGQIVFPGAFNPMHAGHQRMAELAAEWFDRPVEFELSIQNVDKPTLGTDEIARRVEQFQSQHIVWITRAPTFYEKARQFPAATFLIGFDTLQRLIDPSYYNRGSRGRDASLTKIYQQDCRFVVFGRETGGQFRTAAELDLPAELSERCQTVSSDQFRLDISSTQLRRASEDPSEAS
ncbi:MAG: adenylyltransferase/cytidyltransferase family protein [Planctomycetaceae bacterium]|nr:adenylyltransferase/cytidyltransferase family protein [Planctomycetaceae bacterium]